jgi:hypothetical protein
MGIFKSCTLNKNVRYEIKRAHKTKKHKDVLTVVLNFYLYLWEAKAKIYIEAGQLEVLAKRVRRFFGYTNWEKRGIVAGKHWSQSAERSALPLDQLFVG